MSESVADPVAVTGIGSVAVIGTVSGSVTLVPAPSAGGAFPFFESAHVAAK